MSHVLNRRFLVALSIALLAGLIFKLSYFQENPEAYVYPAVVAMGMLGLALFSLVREAFDLCMDDFEAAPVVKQIPALLMMVIAAYVLESVGMYTTTFVLLFCMSYWYSNRSEIKVRLLHSALLGIGFTLAMYGLFALLLKVQLPQGWLI